MKKITIVLISVILIALIFFIIQLKPIFLVSKGEKIQKHKNPQKALLVIDIQRELTEKDGKATLNLKQTDQIIKTVNSIINKSDKMNLIVIYVRHIFKKNFILKLISKGALFEGSQYTEIDPRVKIINNNIFIKHIMDAFSNPNLDKFLIKNKVNHLFISGLDAEYCVDKTLKAALNRNYKVTVISDGIATSSEKKRNKKLKKFSKLGANIVSSEELLK